MLQLAPVLTLSNLADHMIPIEGGVFEMGGESYLDDAKPIHKVRLSDFELCRYLVSQQLWYEVMGTNPDRLMFQNPHRPVERISWDDIMETFLPRLRSATGDATYCLPTGNTRPEAVNTRLSSRAARTSRLPVLIP
jgi:formylglycine-generating enzyme